MARFVRAVAILATLSPSVALAHPAVDAGRSAFENAEFVEALDAFARAEAADDLDRDALIALFATRAQVHLAMRNEEAMRADLARLATVDPSHAFGRRAPPDLRRAFAEIRAESPGAIRLAIDASARGDGVSVGATADNDPQGLVREVRVFGRARGASSWERAIDAPLFVSAGGQVEYYVEAVGPGGVVLAAIGSADAPERQSSRSRRIVDSEPADSSASAGSDDTALWVVLGIGIALAVSAAIAIPVGVVLNDEASRQTVVQPFTVEF